jgi:circadian clock protein KaiB
VSARFGSSVERQEGSVVVRFRGELDEAALRDARGALDVALAATSDVLAIELGELEFMDSAGIWLVVDTHRRCLQQGVELRLEGEQLPPVAHALGLSGVEELVRQDRREPPVSEDRATLRLYISSGSPAGVAIERALRSIEERMAGKIELEVIDVFAEPERAQRDRVIATPTLIKVRPEPELRLIGSLADPQAVLRHLALEHFAA